MKVSSGRSYGFEVYARLPSPFAFGHGAKLLAKDVRLLGEVLGADPSYRRFPRRRRALPCSGYRRPRSEDDFFDRPISPRRQGRRRDRRRRPRQQHRTCLCARTRRARAPPWSSPIINAEGARRSAMKSSRRAARRSPSASISPSPIRSRKWPRRPPMHSAASIFSSTMPLSWRSSAICQPSTFRIEQWNRIMDVNLTGALICAQAIVPLMRARGGGKIVNQVSGGAFPAMSVYGISKLALVGLTTTLARQLGREKINVNAIAPGNTMSDAGKLADSRRLAVRQIAGGHRRDAGAWSTRRIGRHTVAVVLIGRRLDHGPGDCTSTGAGCCVPDARRLSGPGRPFSRHPFRERAITPAGDSVRPRTARAPRPARESPPESAGGLFHAAMPSLRSKTRAARE